MKTKGWERVASKDNSIWSSSTRQFIPSLLGAIDVLPGMLTLDVGCGPGYVSAVLAARGAQPIGLDFSAEMIAFARQAFPRLEFREGDALYLSGKIFFHLAQPCSIVLL